MEKPNLPSMQTLLNNVWKTGAVSRPQSDKLRRAIKPVPAPVAKICKGCSLPGARKIGSCSYCGTPLNRPYWSPRFGLFLVMASTLASTLWVTADETWMLPSNAWLMPFNTITHAVSPISIQTLRSWMAQVPFRLPSLSMPKLFVPALPTKAEIDQKKPSVPAVLDPMSVSTHARPDVSVIPGILPARPDPVAPPLSSTPAVTCGGFPVKSGTPEPDFGPYLAQVQQKIRSHWQPPKMDQSKHVVVLYRIACNGRLMQARVQRSSGLPVADQAAIRAVRSASPFPALPVQYAGKSVDVEFDFDYEMAGHKSQPPIPTFPRP